MTYDLGDWTNFYTQAPAIAATLLVISIGTRAFIPRGLPSEGVLKLEQVLTVIELSVALTATLAMLIPNRLLQSSLVVIVSLIALGFTLTHSIAFFIAWKKHEPDTYSAFSITQAFGDIAPTICYVFLILLHLEVIPWNLDLLAVPVLWLFFSGTFQTILYVQRHLARVDPVPEPPKVAVEVTLVQRKKSPCFLRKGKGS